MLCEQVNVTCTFRCFEPAKLGLTVAEHSTAANTVDSWTTYSFVWFLSLLLSGLNLCLCLALFLFPHTVHISTLPGNWAIKLYWGFFLHFVTCLTNTMVKEPKPSRDQPVGNSVLVYYRQQQPVISQWLKCWNDKWTSWGGQRIFYPHLLCSVLSSSCHRDNPLFVCHYDLFLSFCL